MKRHSITMKSFKKTGNPGEQSPYSIAGVKRTADRATDFRASHAVVGRAGSSRLNRAALHCALWANLLCFAVLSFSGCSSTRPKLAAISVTDPNSGGAISTVVVLATANVSATVSSDGPNLGVDWALNCGGSPNTTLESTNVCGTLNPVHVGSSVAMLYTAPAYVPVGNTVTLTATATSDPAISASVNITIVPKPVTIAWVQGEMPPAVACPSGISYCMAASGAAFQSSPQQADAVQLGATVSNDPTAVGVNWSCTPADTCGSFSPSLAASGDQTTYTAPATALASIPSGGFPVTITATPACETEKLNPCSSSASIGAAVVIMPVAVSAATVPSTVAAGGGTATLTATVSWDASNDGVTWATPACSAGAGACGSITPVACTVGVAPVYSSTCTATYEAPDAIPAGATTLPIALGVASSADPSKTWSGTITVGPPPPIGVTVAGPPGSSPTEVQVNGTVVLTATVTDDFSNAGTSSGVTWSCSPGSCSPTTSTSLPFTTNYTAPSAVPSTNPVIVSATSIFCTQNPGSIQCANDPGSTGSVNITIIPEISVAITPPSSITAGAAATFSATVTGDSSNAGVDWSASCSISSNCGVFTPTHSASGATVTFVAPNNLPWTEDPNVTIAATSTASESAPPVFPSPYLQPGAGVQDPVSVTVIPVTYVHFVPFAPSQLPIGGNAVSLIAVAANDTTNSGVDWSVCSNASTCGVFQVNPAVPATASVGKDAVYSSTIHAASGQAVSYLPPTAAPTGGSVTIAVASTATPAASASQAVAITNNSTFSGVTLTGKVMAGNLPVSGANVQLYQAGNTGYGSAANPLTITQGGASSVTTGSDGSFTIPAGYTCSPANTLLYLVATGGTPGGKSAPNGQLGLMSALGACEGLNSSVSLVVNEITTVASAWALAPFTGTGGGSFQNYEYIGASSANYNNGPILIEGQNNYNGLANAFATVNNLVDITTGQALLVTPAGGGFVPPGGTSTVYDGIVPDAEINTLADAIDTCAATTGGAPGDGSACDLFFQASNVNPVGGIATPSNSPGTILQAVLELAKYPAKMGINGDQANFPNSITGTPIYSRVFDLVKSGGTPPFNKILSAPPTDWSISLSFTGGGLEGVKKARPNSAALAIDASGNLWIANPGISSVTELTNLGAVLSPNASYVTGTKQLKGGGFTGAGLNKPQQIVIDPYGDAWALNTDNSLSESTPACPTSTLLNPFCSSGSFTYAGGAGNAAVNLAIDAIGNVWVADSGTPGDVAEYAGFYSCQNGAACASGSTQLSTGTLIGDRKNLTDPSDDPTVANPQTIAIDAKQNVWVLDSGNHTAVELNGKNGSVELVDYGYQAKDPITGNPISPVLSSQMWGATMEIDSSGDIFIPSQYSQGFDQIYELDACPSGSGGNCGLAPSQPISLSQIAPAGFASPLAIDGSNALWLVSDANDALLQPASVLELSASGSFLNGNTPTPGFGYVASTYAPMPIVPGSTVTYYAATPWSPTPVGIGADASGNLWVLSGGIVTQVVEFIGVATPTVTPLSLGKPGSKP